MEHQSATVAPRAAVIRSLFDASDAFHIPDNSNNSMIKLFLRLFASTVLISLSLLSTGTFAEEAGQLADWAARRAQAQVLREQAAGIKSEADTTFSLEEGRCYEQVLTNRCRDEARRNKVAAYQQARRMDIEARQIDLAVRREEKRQKEADFAASAPDREFKVRQRAEATEARNQKQAESREKRIREGKLEGKRAGTAEAE